MFTNLEKRIDEHRTLTEIENIRKYQTEVTELKITITKMKNT